ncbi:hypothetical protein, partial [Thiolapillus sp.]
IYGKEEDPGSSRQALVRMLSKAKRLKIQRAGSANIALQKHSLLDVFVLAFCEELLSMANNFDPLSANKIDPPGA